MKPTESLRIGAMLLAVHGLVLSSSAGPARAEEDEIYVRAISSADMANPGQPVEAARPGAGVVAQAGTPDAGDSPETEADTDTKPPPPSGIEEITVTARKREETLQDTPVAVTAFTETEILDRDIRQLAEITDSVPTLQFDHAIGTANSARIYLRGVGNGDPISSDDPGVGVYLDGVFLPRAQGAILTTADIERIEVLRGPQGTLFGKNTIGGAISVTTKKPDPSEFRGYGSVRLGNYDRFDTRLAMNVPLVDERLAARLSFATATREGFVSNKSTGRDFQDDKLLAGRVQLRYTPSDALEVNLSYDQSEEDRAPFGGKCVVVNRRSPATGAEPVGVDVDGDGIVESAPSAVAFASLVGVPLADQVAIAQAGFPADLNRFYQSCAQDALRDVRSVASDLDNIKDDLGSQGANLTVSYELENGMTFRSISAWRHNDVLALADLDYTELDFAQATRNAGGEDQYMLSQELQLLGDALDGRLEYVIGLYAFREDIDDTAFGGLATTTPLVIGGNLGFRTDPDLDVRADTELGLAIRDGLVEPSELGAILLPGETASGGVNVAIPGAVTRTIRKVDNLGYAAFTQGTYDLTDRLALTLGARITSERKRVSNEIFAETPGFVGANVRREGELDFGFERSERFKDLSPMANLSYQATDDLMLYTTFARGFKSGGFNGRANAPALTVPIDDERLTSYEVGLKSAWFDSRLVVNAAAFWSIYEDIQLTIPSGDEGQAQILVLNAGEAEIKGGELEARALPTPNLELGASLGVVNGRYTEFDDPSDAFAEDRRLLATPNYTMDFFAGYMLSAGRFGDVRLRAEWSHRGASGTDVVDTPVLRKGKHGELSAQILWLLPDAQTEILLWGDNLLDREYIVNGVSLASSLGHAYRFYNAPRTYGIELRRYF